MKKLLILFFLSIATLSRASQSQVRLMGKIKLPSAEILKERLRKDFAEIVESTRLIVELYKEEHDAFMIATIVNDCVLTYYIQPMKKDDDFQQVYENMQEPRRRILQYILQDVGTDVIDEAIQWIEGEGGRAYLH